MGPRLPLGSTVLLHKDHFSQCQKKTGLSFLTTQGNKKVVDSVERKSITKHKEKRLSFLSDGKRVHRSLKNLLNSTIIFCKHQTRKRVFAGFRFRLPEGSIWEANNFRKESFSCKVLSVIISLFYLLNFSLCFRAANFDNSQSAKHFLKRSLKEIIKNDLIYKHHFVNWKPPCLLKCDEFDF